MFSKYIMSNCVSIDGDLSFTVVLTVIPGPYFFYRCPTTTVQPPCWNILRRAYVLGVFLLKFGKEYVVSRIIYFV